MIKKLLLTLGVLSGMAWSQAAGAYGGTAQFPQGNFVPNASVYVCNAPANATPCTNKPTIYTDATSNITQADPIVLNATNLGQFSFGAAAGNYVVQVIGPGLNTYSFPVTIGVGQTTLQLCYAKSASPVTGNSSDQAVFNTGTGFSGGNCTLAAGIVGPGKGLRIVVATSHTSGSATVTYKVLINGSNIDSPNYCQNAAQNVTQEAELYFNNDPGSQASNGTTSMCMLNSGSSATFGTSSINTTGVLTVVPTFSVANTDSVTPQFFLVELVQ